jgi:hypothetical protein
MKTAFAFLSAALAAGGAAAHGHDARLRLIVADAAAPVIHVVDAGAGPVARFDLASPARLYRGPGGRHAWAVQREAGLVQLLDTGRITEDHGDHAAVVLGAPALLPAAATGDRPVHLTMDAARVAVFWDGSGVATLHDAAAAGAGDLSPAAVLQTGRPHHGVAVPVGDAAILSVAPEGEGLPDALAVLGPDGAELSRVACLNLHGEGKAGRLIAFGCEDGVAIFDASAAPPAGRFVPYPPDAPTGGMIRQLLSPAATMALVGSWGSDGIVILDPSAPTGDFAFAAVPAPRMAFALNDGGDMGFASLADGRLVRFSALTGRILAAAAGVTAAYSMERGVVRPMIAAAGDRVAVSDPATGQVVLLDAETLAVVERITVGGAPQSLLLLTAEGDHGH